MALTFTPPFVQTAFGGPVTLTVITAIASGTGAATIVTGAANGTSVRGIQFMCATAISDAIILIYHTNKLIGAVPIAWGGGQVPTASSLPASAIWFNPNPEPVNLKNTEVITAGYIGGGSPTIHAYALGGDF